MGSTRVVFIRVAQAATYLSQTKHCICVLVWLVRKAANVKYLIVQYEFVIIFASTCHQEEHYEYKHERTSSDVNIYACSAAYACSATTIRAW